MNDATSAALALLRGISDAHVSTRRVNNCLGQQCGTRIVVSAPVNRNANEKAAIATLRGILATLRAELPAEALAALRTPKTRQGKMFRRDGFWNMGRFVTTAIVLWIEPKGLSRRAG